MNVSAFTASSSWGSSDAQEVAISDGKWKQVITSGKQVITGGNKHGQTGRHEDAYGGIRGRQVSVLLNESRRDIVLIQGCCWAVNSITCGTCTLHLGQEVMPPAQATGRRTSRYRRAILIHFPTRYATSWPLRSAQEGKDTSALYIDELNKLNKDEAKHNATLLPASAQALRRTVKSSPVQP